ncbi:MAG: hypothetical protein K6L76_14455 [Agarilytica sp.]
MKKTSILNTFLFSMLCLSINESLADDAPQEKSAYRNLYNNGITAYKNKDYVTALKYLFSYRLVNENKLVEHEKFSSQLDAAIEHSERKLRDTIKLANGIEKKETESAIRAAGF